MTWECSEVIGVKYVGLMAAKYSDVREVKYVRKMTWECFEVIGVKYVGIMAAVKYSF